MKYISILILLILSSCSEIEVKPDIYGVYDDGDSGALIINQNYIDYLNAWYTTEYNLTQDSLIFHVSRAVDGKPDEIITWWFQLEIGQNTLQGNNYKTVNFNPDFIEERGIIYFTK